MQTKQSEQENLRNYTGTDSKGKSTSPRNWEKIEETPFGIVNDPERGYFISLGANRMTECYNTAEEAIDQLEIQKWEIIMKMIIIVSDAKELVDKEMEEKGIPKYIHESIKEANKNVE